MFSGLSSKISEFSGVSPGLNLLKLPPGDFISLHHVYDAPFIVNVRIH